MSVITYINWIIYTEKCFCYMIFGFNYSVLLFNLILRVGKELVCERFAFSPSFYGTL